MKVPKIINAEALNSMVLRVTFNNGDIREYDVTPLLDRAPFHELKNTFLFKAVKIEPGGHAVIWNDRIDLSEYELWKNGVEPI